MLDTTSGTRAVTARAPAAEKIENSASIAWRLHRSIAAHRTADANGFRIRHEHAPADEGEDVRFRHTCRQGDLARRIDVVSRIDLH